MATLRARTLAVENRATAPVMVRSFGVVAEHAIECWDISPSASMWNRISCSKPLSSSRRRPTICWALDSSSGGLGTSRP
jgi:hypothetical protein